MRTPATETSYNVKENLINVNVPIENLVGAAELNQLKLVTDNHAELLNNTELVDKYTCSDEVTALYVGYKYKDFLSSDITINSFMVNVSEDIVTTPFQIKITIGGVYQQSITIPPGLAVAKVAIAPTSFTAQTPILIEVIAQDLTVYPIGLKVKLIGALTVATV